MNDPSNDPTMLVRLLYFFLLHLSLISSNHVINPTVLTQNTTCASADIQYPFAAVFDFPTALTDYSLLTGARPGFEIYCNDGGFPTLLLGGHSYVVINVSVTGGFVRVAGRSLAWHCKDNSEGESLPPDSAFNLYGTPYTFSDSRNRLTAIGCAALAILRHGNRTSGCVSFCDDGDGDGAINGSCSGLGCCQSAIPAPGLKHLQLNFSSVRSLTGSRNDSRPCSRAFITDKDWFNFSTEDLSNQMYDQFRPVVLEWWIGEETCKVAERRPDYACKANSECIDSPYGAGYRCRCLDGYAKNPYIECQDADECIEYNPSPCVGKCHNTPGNFTCSCPWGHTGDGRRNGDGCHRIPLLEIGLSVGLGFIVFLLAGGSLAYLLLKKHRERRLKQKNFLQNGGLLLQQQISTREASAKIFSSDELEKATDNFHESRILGRGGYGIVYRGILPDGSPVAIKKSKTVDETQIVQFINEVVILSQIRHRHVVKLLGCCLETHAPLLVYEFIPNGTLFQHLHNGNAIAHISWENRLRIAVETASALAYLHCVAAVPIIHRDVKSANILLDEEYRAKVSDFGASRLVPYNHTHITTVVQGTLGYLDPEYFQTSLLTNKSDVYSFGVVLVEILTREKPVAMEKSLVRRFVELVDRKMVLETIDHQTVREAGLRHVLAVAELARRCLSLNGSERPPMKEVAVELDALRRLMRIQLAQRAQEEHAALLNGSDTGVRSPIPIISPH